MGWRVRANPTLTSSVAMVKADFTGHHREKLMLMGVIKGPTRGMAALAFMEVRAQGEGTISMDEALEVSIER
jgi:hypothetical protein